MTKPQIFETYRGMVMAQEIDSNGHMNVQFYSRKFDAATAQFMMLIGHDLKEFKAQELGFAYVELTIKYLRELFEDQAVHIETEVVDCANKVVTLQHTMKNSATGDIASIAIVKWVIFDKVARRAVPLPESLRSEIMKRTNTN